MLVVASYNNSPFGIMGEVLRMLTNLIEYLDDFFLIPFSVHRPIVKLLRTCSDDDEKIALYEEALVNLMHTICVKVRSYPELLNVFLYDQTTARTFDLRGNAHSTPSSPLPHPLPNNYKKANPPPSTDYEFLLFSILLRFVHRDGKMGDRARSGVELIVQLDIEESRNYISFKSDFAVVLAASLGALFSTLPLRIAPTTSPHSITSTAPPHRHQGIKPGKWQNRLC